MELKLMSFNVASTAGEGWSWMAIGVIADQIDNEKRPQHLAECDGKEISGESQERKN